MSRPSANALIGSGMFQSATPATFCRPSLITGASSAKHPGNPNGASDIGKGMPPHEAASKPRNPIGTLRNDAGRFVNCIRSVEPMRGNDPATLLSCGTPAGPAQPVPYETKVAGTVLPGTYSHVELFATVTQMSRAES